MSDIDVLILCGGQGTRLQKVVTDRPKSMAEINDRPFLDILISYVASFGFRRFVFCTGFKEDHIRKYFSSKNRHIDFLFSREELPLGTGGAIKNAEALIQSDSFIVLNGDSFCQIDLNKFLGFHKTKKALLSIAIAEAENAKDFGSIVLDKSNKIIAFKEKTTDSFALINAGIYLFDRKILSMIPPDIKYSLEYDLFPKLVSNKFFGFVTKEPLIDIGTPERYEFAKKLFNSHNFTKLLPTC
jgi:NDP-sugar pyrophosphorylase family protein